ncbi:MAG TPA: PAS domain S-box protein [Spirochaetales bacterium]|nr:PAS domain S-box protein [Spirochaetales bacterium]
MAKCNWEVVFAPAPKFFTIGRNIGPWSALITFLFLSALLTIYVIQNRRRARIINALVERRTAELTEQRNLMRTVFSTTPDLMILQDLDSVYQTANEAFCSLIGINMSEIAGKTDFDFFPPDKAEEYRKRDREVIESGEPMTIDEEVTGIRGKRWLSVTRTPVYDADGNMNGLLYSFDVCAQPRFFTQNGLRVNLKTAPGWSGIKELMANGRIDAAHMLAPLPLACSLGLDGIKSDINLAVVQNINGQALTLAKKHLDIKDERDMKGFRFGVPYRFSMHYYLLAFFLAEKGLNPLTDVTIEEIAPQRLPYYLKKGY